MKKLTKLTLAVFAVLFGLISTANISFAETTQAPEDILSKNTFALITIDPTELKEPLKSYYGTLIEGFFLPEIFGVADTNTPESAPWNLLKTQLSSTTKVTLAVKILPSGEAAILFIEMPEDEFVTNIRDTYLTGTELPTESDIQIYRPQVYEPTEGNDPNLTFAYFNGYLLIGDSETTLKTVISEYGTNPLSESANFSKVMSKMPSTSAVTVFVDVIDALEVFVSDASELQDQAFLAAGFSLDQLELGFKLKTYTLQNPEKIKELGLDFDTDLPLSLYKYMPKENFIFFGDNSITGKTISALLNMFFPPETIASTSNDFGINIENLLPIIENEMAFVLKDNDELLPAFTFLSDTKNSAEMVKTGIDSVLNLFWTTVSSSGTPDSTDNKIIMDTDEATVTFQKNTIQLGEGDVTQYEISISQKLSKNPYAIKLPDDLLKFKITIGVTGDNIFIFSTDKNIASTYKEGLQNNSKIKSLLSDEIDGVSYFDVKNLNSYLQSALTKAEESFPEMADVSAAKTYINALLKAFDSGYATFSMDNESNELNLTLNINLEELIADINNLQVNFEALEGANVDNVILNSQTEFNDVKPTDWYGDNVYYLSTEGIIDGYEDGSFKPGNNINRAEFIKLIVTTLEEQGYLDNPANCEECANFKDIKDDEWYATYVQEATDSGIIGGYDDNTFRANQPISRAEVAQILANILTKLNIADNLSADEETLPAEETFKDVNKNEWYIDAIETVDAYDLMQGTSEGKFEPSRPINRAESAKVIKNLIELIK